MMRCKEKILDRRRLTVYYTQRIRMGDLHGAGFCAIRPSMTAVLARADIRWPSTANGNDVSQTVSRQSGKEIESPCSIASAIPMAEAADMNDIVKYGMLYDFYGELLTRHQREIYEQFVADDFSLSEIAENAGTSRQAVFDIIRRSNERLIMYEDKLRLVERFRKVREKINEINALLSELAKADAGSARDEGPVSLLIAQIREITGDIMEEL